MSVIAELYQGMDLLGIFVLTTFIGVLFFIVVLTIYIHILHPLLSRKLDSILFNKNWFTHAELSIYSLWPLSLIRSVIYTFLITFPDLAVKTKRFKGFDLTLPLSPFLRGMSKVYIILHFLALFVGIAMFISFLVFYITEMA